MSTPVSSYRTAHSSQGRM